MKFDQKTMSNILNTILISINAFYFSKILMHFKEINLRME